MAKNKFDNSRMLTQHWGNYDPDELRNRNSNTRVIYYLIASEDKTLFALRIKEKQEGEKKMQLVYDSEYILPIDQANILSNYLNASVDEETEPLEIEGIGEIRMFKEDSFVKFSLKTYDSEIEFYLERKDKRMQSVNSSGTDKMIPQYKPRFDAFKKGFVFTNGPGLPEYRVKPDKITKEHPFLYDKDYDFGQIIPEWFYEERKSERMDDIRNYEKYGVAINTNSLEFCFRKKLKAVEGKKLYHFEAEN